MSTAVEIQAAYVTIERHRCGGPEQAPKCKRCRKKWPCRPRIKANNVIHGVYVDAWAGR